ncbi:MAG: hypothetical protein ABI407_15760, partial [Bradyrhizobium sp.]
MTTPVDRSRQRAEPIPSTGIMVWVGVNTSEVVSKRREMPIMCSRFVVCVLYGFALGLSALTAFPAHA